MALDLKLQTPGPSDGATPIAMDESSTPDSEELSQFRVEFEKRMPSSTKPTNHTSAAALLLSFHAEAGGPNNIDVKDEVEQLEHTFRNDYNFVVENKVIGGDRAGLEMLQSLINFTYENDKERALLIVYYAGHGWRSNDNKRIRAGGFDLAPKGLHPRETPSGDSIVMWEKTEQILHQAKCDVLVIFDCCDAGSLNYMRSRGRAFEYLGACERAKFTHPPGRHSFTSAMIWALKKLKTEKAFTTATLRDTIRQHDFFPDKQEPVLFSRKEYIPEHVWISPIRSGETPIAEPRGSSSPLEFRDADCSFVDVRVFFNKHLSTDDADNFADMMRPLVVDSNLALNARHVEVRNKSICYLQSPRSAIDNVWRTAKVIQMAQRWVKQLNKEDLAKTSTGSSQRKRKWNSEPDMTQLLQVVNAAQPVEASTYQDDGSDADDKNSPLVRKRPRRFEARQQSHHRTEQSLAVNKRPVTPISEGHGSEAETIYQSQVETIIEPSVNALVTLRSSSENLSNTAMKSLENLERSILLHPESDILLHIQAIRALMEK